MNKQTLLVLVLLHFNLDFLPNYRISDFVFMRNDTLKMVHVGTCSQNPPPSSPYGLKQVGLVVPSYIKA